MRKLTTTIDNVHNLIKKGHFWHRSANCFLAFHASMRVAELALPKNKYKTCVIELSMIYNDRIVFFLSRKEHLPPQQNNNKHTNVLELHL